MSIDVLTVGESLGLLAPERTGRLAHVRDMRLGFGGAESNVAIGIARLGGRSAWCGRVGDDGIGEMIVREIRAEGVEVLAAIDDAVPTAVMIKERPRPGETRVIYYRDGRAGSRLRAEDIPEGAVERARVLHVTGITPALGDSAHRAVLAAVERARAAGVLVSFDVNHRSSLWQDERSAVAAYRALAARADIVFAGEDEAQLVTGESDVQQQIGALRAMGPATVVIKRGADGALAAVDEEMIESPALRVDAVDTVGAGDAFVAGWLAETVRDAAASERMRTAIACGAVACTGVGDWETAATRDDLRALNDPDADPVRR